MRWLSLKEGEPTGLAILRVGLTSPPQIDTGLIEARLISRETIRGQGGKKEEEVRFLSGGYQRHGNSIQNVLLPNNNNPPAIIYCAQLLEKPGTLSSLGSVCTTP